MVPAVGSRNPSAAAASWRTVASGSLWRQRVSQASTCGASIQRRAAAALARSRGDGCAMKRAIMGKARTEPALPRAIRLSRASSGEGEARSFRTTSSMIRVARAGAPSARFLAIVPRASSAITRKLRVGAWTDSHRTVASASGVGFPTLANAAISLVSPAASWDPSRMASTSAACACGCPTALSAPVSRGAVTPFGLDPARSVPNRRLQSGCR